MDITFPGLLYLITRILFLLTLFISQFTHPLPHLWQPPVCFLYLSAWFSLGGFGRGFFGFWDLGFLVF